MLDALHKIWNVKHVEGDEFTGYESVYEQLDSFDKNNMMQIHRRPLIEFMKYIAV